MHRPVGLFLSPQVFLSDGHAHNDAAPHSWKHTREASFQIIRNLPVDNKIIQPPQRRHHSFAGRTVFSRGRANMLNAVWMGDSAWHFADDSIELL